MVKENRTSSILPMRNKTWYRAFLWVLLVGGLILLAYLSPTLTNPLNYSTDDFFPYWAAGRLNLQGENPYDGQKKDAMQVEVSGHGSNTYPVSIMLNPPFAVTMVMPFGLLGYPLARMAWLIVSIASIVFSAQLCWQIYNGASRQRWLAWAAIILFGPMISVLEVGQISALILLGVTCFLYFTHVRRNDWAAGVCLVLVAIKPQVFYLFWIALLFWVIQHRRWVILASFAASMLGLTLVAIMFNPHVLAQYLDMVQQGYLPELATPTIGAYLRFFWLGTDKFWLQFVAPVVGGLWMLYYWYRHNPTWSWAEQMPVLLLASQVSAPYTYTYDQVILIPVVILVMTKIGQNWKSWTNLILLAVYLAINILDLVLHMKLSDFWFVWLAPAFLIWFILARKQLISPPAMVALASPTLE